MVQNATAGAADNLTPPHTGSIFADYLYSTFGFGLESLKLLHVRLSSSAEAVPVVPKSRLKTTSGRAFAVRAPRLWDDLPEEIRPSRSAKSFKSFIKGRKLYEMLHHFFFYVKSA